MGIGRLANVALRPMGLGVSVYKTAARAAPLPAAAVPATNIAQEHFDGCRVLSSREAWLDTLPKGLAMLEAGVADGDFSAEILSRCKPSCLYLIDAWESDRYAAGQHRVIDRFANQIADGSVIIRRGYSTNEMNKMQPESLDLVYLDTSHEYLDTVSELSAAAALLCTNGRLAGHDFCAGNPRGVPYGVIPAVYEFCTRERWRMESICLEGDGYFTFCLVRT